MAYPIRIDGLVDAVNDGPSFFGYFAGQKWADPSVAHLRELMRRVYSHREVRDGGCPVCSECMCVKAGTIT